MILTPKKDFLAKKPIADHHRELVVSTAFREALSAAIVHYVASKKAVNDPVEAAANCHRLEGAMEFVETLLNIGEVQKTPSERAPTNLNHVV